MPQALRYIIAQNKDLAGSVTVKDGKILVNIKNYTHVYKDPINPEDSAYSCYALLIDTEKIHECPDKPGTLTEKIWDGTRDGQRLPQRLVPCELYSLKSPLGGLSAELLNTTDAAQKELTAAQEEVAALDHKLNEAQGKLSKQYKRVAAVTEKSDQLAKQVSNLQAELVEAQTSTIIRNMDVHLLADAINHCEDQVLIALPYIGEENLQYLKRWAQETAKKVEDNG